MDKNNEWKLNVLSDFEKRTHTSQFFETGMDIMNYRVALPCRIYRFCNDIFYI